MPGRPGLPVLWERGKLGRTGRVTRVCPSLTGRHEGPGASACGVGRGIRVTSSQCNVAGRHGSLPMDTPLDTLEIVSQPEPASASATGPRGGQVWLGVFILGQIAFLLISNFLGMISYAHPKRHAHSLQPLVEQVAPGVREGQDHFWKLLEGITT